MPEFRPRTRKFVWYGPYRMDRTVWWPYYGLTGKFSICHPELVRFLNTVLKWNHYRRSYKRKIWQRNLLRYETPCVAFPNFASDTHHPVACPKNKYFRLFSKRENPNFCHAPSVGNVCWFAVYFAFRVICVLFACYLCLVTIRETRPLKVRIMIESFFDVLQIASHRLDKMLNSACWTRCYHVLLGHYYVPCFLQQLEQKNSNLVMLKKGGIWARVFADAFHIFIKLSWYLSLFFNTSNAKLLQKKRKWTLISSKYKHRGRLFA